MLKENLEKVFTRKYYRSTYLYSMKTSEIYGISICGILSDDLIISSYGIEFFNCINCDPCCNQPPNSCYILEITRKGSVYTFDCMKIQI